MGFRDVICLVQNISDEDVTFTNAHRDRATHPLKWWKIICKPGRFVMLPHFEYNATMKNGGMVKLTYYYGPSARKIFDDVPEFIDFVPSVHDK